MGGVDRDESTIRTPPRVEITSHCAVERKRCTERSKRHGTLGVKIVQREIPDSCPARVGVGNDPTTIRRQRRMAIAVLIEGVNIRDSFCRDINKVVLVWSVRWVQFEQTFCRI